jgi:hypothetical protein
MAHLDVSEALKELYNSLDDVNAGDHARDKTRMKMMSRRIHLTC